MSEVSRIALITGNRVDNVIAVSTGTFSPEMYAGYDCRIIGDEIMPENIGPGWEYNTETKQWYNPADVQTRDELLQISAGVRFSRETSGVMVGEHRFSTTRESQSMITGAYMFMLQSGGATPIRFKTLDQFITVSDAATMSEIAIGVANHVQACFAAEAVISSEIMGGDISSIDEINARYDQLLGGANEHESD